METQLAGRQALCQHHAATIVVTERLIPRHHRVLGHKLEMQSPTTQGDGVALERIIETVTEALPPGGRQNIDVVQEGIAPAILDGVAEAEHGIADDHATLFGDIDAAPICLPFEQRSERDDARIGERMPVLDVKVACKPYKRGAVRQPRTPDDRFLFRAHGSAALARSISSRAARVAVPGQFASSPGPLVAAKRASSNRAGRPDAPKDRS